MPGSLAARLAAALRGEKLQPGVNYNRVGPKLVAVKVDELVQPPADDIDQAIADLSDTDDSDSEQDELEVAIRAAFLNPRDYQLEGIKALRDAHVVASGAGGVRDWRGRFMLTDAPGLGKTLQAAEAAERPCVISVPSTLAVQWAEFLETQYPDDKVVIACKGDIIKRDAALKQPFDWLIVNHDMWRTYFVPTAKTIIIDEYHHFRNRSAKRAQGLRDYCKRVGLERVYGLTATPVYKDVGDLWFLLHIMYPRHPDFTSYNSFIDRWAVTSNYGFGTKVVKVRNQKVLDQYLSQYMIGRTYRDVGMQLPKRIDKHVVLELDAGMRKVYNQLRDFYRLEIFSEDDPTQIDEIKRWSNAGAVLHELRKITVTKEKLDACREIVDDTPGDEPVIVFCWYKDTAAKAGEALDGVVITGDEAPDKRRELARTGGPDNKRVRVATMESLSEGVDISDARTLIILEDTYVPGKQYQAITRVVRHRTALNADNKPVIAHWVRYKNTVDEIVFNTARSRTKGNALTVLREALEQPD